MVYISTMDFLLDDDGEFVLSATGDLSLTSSLSQEKKQEITIALMTHKGEWIYDESVGIPWRTILGKKNNDVQLLSYVKNTILDIDDVISCDTSITHDDVTATVTFSATLSDGTTTEGTV